MERTLVVSANMPERQYYKQYFFMRKLYTFAIVAVLSLIAQMASAQTEIDFTQLTATATTDPKGYTLTEGDYTFTAVIGSGQTTPVHNSNYKDLRHYAGNILTVSGASMKQMVFVVSTAGKKRQAEITPSTGTVTVDTENWTVTWTSDEAVSEVTFTVGDKSVYGTDGSSKAGQFNVDKVTITADGGGEPVVQKKAAGLAFSAETVDYELGTVWPMPTFTKETTAEVTFTSDNEEVATVGANGDIYPTGVEGKAVITATAEENDEYKAGTATCTVYVWHYNVYTKAEAIESGKSYLLVAQRGDTTAYAMPAKESYTYGYLNGSLIKEHTDTVKVKSSYDDTFTFTGADGVYSIKDCYGRYLYNDGSHNSFSFTTEEEKTWDVEPQADGTFKILFGDYYIQWGQGTYTSFGVYEEAQDNAVLPYLFELVDESTGIDTVNADKTVKSGAMYNLAGQRVGKDYKGIVIMDGKKYVQK